MVSPAIAPRMEQWDDKSREGVYAVCPGVLANDIALPAGDREIVGIVRVERGRRRAAPDRPRQDVIDRERPATNADSTRSESALVV